MPDLHAQVLRLVTAELPADEARRLRQEAAADPVLADAIARAEGMRDVLREGAPRSFGPYFSDHVLRRLVPEAAVSQAGVLYDALCALGWRVALGAGVAVAALGAYNAGVLDAETASGLGTLFGWPAESFDAALLLAG